MFNTLAHILNIICGVYGLYAVIIVLLGACRKHRPHPTHAPEKRIAAVIAARNEENVIADCVQTLCEQCYPTDLFDIWVVPNNCTDYTADTARSAGAKILECTVPTKCKGDVLKFAFAELLAQGKYDAFCVFDADNLVNPGFFAAANNALCAGIQVAQGYRDSKNPTESWIATDMSIFHWFMSRFFNRSRRTLGMSAMLNGTGIVLSADLIRKNGWETHTLTEDLEYTAQCALWNVPIDWLPDAVIYDEQPNTLADSFEQRRRWCAGTLQCLRRYGSALWVHAFKARSLQALDCALLFTGSLMQFICLIPGVLSAALSIFFALYRDGFALLLCEGVSLLAASWLVCTSTAALMCLLARRTTQHMWPGILAFVLFMASWLPANICAVFGHTGWKPIVHTSRAKLPHPSERKNISTTPTGTTRR